VAARPTCGCRRISALLNRQLRAAEAAPVKHKRVYRIMQAHDLLLARRHTVRPEHAHTGRAVTLRSNLRWRSDGFEFACWNGEVVRGAVIIDAHDREVMAWCAVANAGVSASDVQDMMLEAVKARFSGVRAPHPVETLTDNGSACTAKDTRIFARQLGLEPCFTPLRSPQSNGISEAFVRTPHGELRAGHAPAGRRLSARVDRHLVRRLQPPPPAPRAEDALAPQVPRSPNRNRLRVPSNGGRISGRTGHDSVSLDKPLAANVREHGSSMSVCHS